MALRLEARNVIFADSAAAIHRHYAARTVPEPDDHAGALRGVRIGRALRADPSRERIPVVDASVLVLKSDGLVMSGARKRNRDSCRAMSKPIHIASRDWWG